MCPSVTVTATAVGEVTAAEVVEVATVTDVMIATATTVVVAMGAAAHTHGRALDPVTAIAAGTDF